jgi:hypothetical protein
MSKFLSLEWFKGTAEKAIEKVVASKLDKLMEEETDVSEYKKPYLNIKLINDTLTVVLSNGNVLVKTNATEEHFNSVINAKNEEEIVNIVASRQVFEDVEKKEKDIKKIKVLQKGIKILEDIPDFHVEENTVYLSGTSRSMPQLLVERFIEIIDRVKQTKGDDFTLESLKEDDEYMAHKNFFMWCCLNPRAEVAHELYRFLTENSFRITKQGFFVALRNVVTLPGSNELVHFISNTYNKVKAVWKKNPNEYTVFLKNDEYKLVHNDRLFEDKIITSTTCPECEGEGQFYDDYEEEYEDCSTCDGSGEVEEYEYTVQVPVDNGQKIGNLVELYLDLPNREENRFTDDWTKTFDIRIGQITSMPQEECNWSTQDCAAAGLHFTADQIHYVGCGDQSVLILINPMKVVGIGTHKGRCYEYLPIMTVPREEATKILHDGMFDTLQLDEEYAIRELESLAERAQEGFAIEAKKYQFNIPSISSEEIGNIVLNLNKMKEAISKRVSTIK